MNKSGFTLVEILVVLAIFATTTVVASGIFVTNTRAQRKVAEVQRAQGDARFTFEALVVVNCTIPDVRPMLLVVTSLTLGAAVVVKLFSLDVSVLPSSSVHLAR